MRFSLLHFSMFPAVADAYRARDSFALLETRLSVLTQTDYVTTASCDMPLPVLGIRNINIRTSIRLLILFSTEGLQ